MSATVTEGVMTAGHFTIPLDQSTPRSFVEQFTPYSFVCVTPGRCDGLSADEVFASATFTGVLRRRSENLCTLEGPSLITLLGDEDQKGPNFGLSISGSPGGGQDMITDLFSFSANVNGLTLGDVSTLPTSPLYAAWKSGPPPENARMFLDRICRFFGWQYRVKANGEVDVAVSGSLFRSTPNVLVLADHLGEPVSDVIRLVVSGTVRNTASVDDEALIVAVYDDTPYYGFSSVTTPTRYGFGTSPPALQLYKWVNGDDVGSDAAAEDQADLEAQTNYAAKDIVDISIALDDPRRRIEPGDMIGVYDPLQGLYDTDNQVDVMGQCLFPKHLEVTEMTWPVTEGMGVYLVLNGTTTVRDLSEYVLWGSGETSLRVGAKAPTLREVVQGRN